MKQFLQCLALTVLCISGLESASGQTWTWGSNVTNASYTLFSAKMAAGINGSFYVGDTYIDTVKIGSKTYKPVNSDFYITKRDSTGNLEWSITDKGLTSGTNPSSFQSALSSLCADKSGNLIAFGHWGFSLNTADRIFIAKYGPTGTKLWNAWAQSASQVASLAALCTDDSGNVYASGHTANTITFYDGDGFTTHPNNVIVAGGQGTEFLVKYSASGVFKWAKEYKASTWPTRAFSLTSTNDGIILCGYTDGGGTLDLGNSVTLTVTNLKKAAFIAKFDFNGGAQWILKAEGNDRPFIAITLDNNSDLIICGKLNNGSIGSFATTSAAMVGLVGKVSSNGTPQWVHFDETSTFKYTQRIGVVASGASILVVGNWYNSSFVTIQRFDASGNYVAVDSATNDTQSNTKVQSIITASNGAIYLAGSYCGTLRKNTVNITSPCDVAKANLYVARIAPTGGTVISGVTETHRRTTPKQFALAQNYPNPFNPSTRIEFAVASPGQVSLTVFNLLGQTVATLVNETLHTGTYSVGWNADNVPTGTYFYRLITATGTEEKRMILSK